MADAIPTPISTRQSIPGYWEVFEATISTNDTVQFRAFETLTNHVVWRASDGTDVTATRAGKTLTITQGSLTSIRVIGMVWGTK